jgi:hypothetical protein
VISKYDSSQRLADALKQDDDVFGSGSDDEVDELEATTRFRGRQLTIQLVTAYYGSYAPNLI